MNRDPRKKLGNVRGPLTLGDLPAPDTRRWVIRRKAEVVAAVRGGLLSLEEAHRRYELSTHELSSWQYCFDQHGLDGLSAARAQRVLRGKGLECRNDDPRMKVQNVRGHDGRSLTLADLPAPDTKRWVIRRKAVVIAAMRGGLLSLEEAHRRYKLSKHELLSWLYCFDRYGFAGLRTTRTQHYLGRSRNLRNVNEELLAKVGDGMSLSLLK